MSKIKNYKYIEKSSFNKGAGCEADWGFLKNNHGITLIALVITIVLMLILASIIVNVVINGGLFDYSKKAIDDTDVANEKEILTKASIFAVEEDKRGELSKENFQKKLNKFAGEEKTTVYDTGEGFEVLFQNSGLYYEVDKKGNVGEYKTAAKDESPANIFLDENGNTLDGTNTPYQINCIEDLVMFSNLSNGKGNYIDSDGNIVDAVYNNFSGKNIELTKTLNFNSPTSYADLSIMWSYDAEADAYIIDEESTTNLMEIITDKDGVGFIPMCLKPSKLQEWFMGCFNGDCHEIKNIYVNRAGTAGLFGYIYNATVKKLGITGTIISTGGSAAGFVGGTASSSRLVNCYSLADITAVSPGAGIVSDASSSLTLVSCYNKGNITAESKAGGLIGWVSINATTNVINCYNLGSVIGNRNHRISIC